MIGLKYSTIAVLLLMAVAACTPLDVATDEQVNETDGDFAGGFSPLVEDVEEVVQEEQQPEPEVPQDSVPTKVVKEGEIVTLSTTSAQDPDNDNIEYIFPEQFDANGVWQTQIGDAGEYLFPVKITDGDLTSELKIRVVVESVNAAPLIENFDNVVVTEGEKIELSPTITDRENDQLTISYSGFMQTPEYQTNFEDAGTYTVRLTVSDEFHTVEEEISVVINDRNRKPILQPFNDVIATVGDIVVIEPIANDPDGDEITLLFSDPFDNTGTFSATPGNEGTYDITVTATDGQADHDQGFQLIIRPENKAPELMIDLLVEAFEGQTVELSPVVSDPDGDDVFVTYSGFMTSSSAYLDYDSAGEYTVTVTATDGTESVSKDVTILVENVNRPPQFVGDIFE